MYLLSTLLDEVRDGYILHGFRARGGADEFTMLTIELVLILLVRRSVLHHEVDGLRAHIVIDVGGDDRDVELARGMQFRLGLPLHRRQVRADRFLLRRVSLLD